MAEKQVYPRIPESNWWILRDQFSRTLPSVVNVSYLKSLLRLGSEKAASNLLSPLKQLKLIDEDGKPTQLANDWRNNARYADACQQIINNVYPEELRSLYSGNDIDRDAIVDWFKYTGEQGERTANMSAAMYILLNEAIPKSSEDFKKKPSGTKSTTTNKTQITEKNSEKPPMPLQTEPKKVIETPATSQNQNTTTGRPQENPVSLHIDLQIHISPEATPDQIDQIFASMAKHLSVLAKHG